MLTIDANDADWSASEATITSGVGNDVTRSPLVWTNFVIGKLVSCDSL